MTRDELKLEYLREVEQSRLKRWQELQDGCNNGDIPKQEVEEARLVYLKARLEAQLCEMDVEAQSRAGTTRSSQ